MAAAGVTLNAFSPTPNSITPCKQVISIALKAFVWPEQIFLIPLFRSAGICSANRLHQLPVQGRPGRIRFPWLLAKPPIKLPDQSKSRTDKYVPFNYSGLSNLLLFLLIPILDRNCGAFFDFLLEDVILSNGKLTFFSTRSDYTRI